MLHKIDKNYFDEDYLKTKFGRIGKYSRYEPDDRYVIGYIHKGTKKKQEDAVVYNNRYYPIKAQKRQFWLKSRGYLALKDGSFVVVKRLRLAPFMLLLMPLALFFIHQPKALPHISVPKNFAGQKDTTKKSKPKAVVRYASYIGMPKTVDLKANTKYQDITLTLPERNGKGEKNPVEAAPSIYIKGSTGYECIYNPVKRNKSGNIVHFGVALKPGYQLNRIKLTKTLLPGKYQAKTVWTPVDIKTGQPSAKMTFKFTAIVK